jgi:predicted aminopeptidase
MVGWDDVELAAIVFHELTHQLLYVANDASFNEALATTVEEEGVKRWLEAQGRDKDLAQHRLEQQHYLKVIELLGATRGKLRVIYASGQPVEAMRDEKRKAFEVLRTEFAALRDSWGGHAPYEGWFDHDVNNAHLATVATYFVCVPGFERELRTVGGDLPAFYRRVRQLSKMPQKARDELDLRRTPGVTLKISTPRAIFLRRPHHRRSWHRQLNEQSAGEHHGDCEKALRDSCDDMDFVHDPYSELKLMPHACRLRRTARGNKLNT